MEGAKGPTLSAMFMTAGLVHPYDNQTYKDYNDIAKVMSDHMGQIEVFQELGQYGELADRIFQDYWTAEKVGAGVYDYEVSEEFGTWFGEYIIKRGQLPDRREADAQLRELARVFFEEAEEPYTCSTCGHTLEEHRSSYPGVEKCWHGSGEGNSCPCKRFEGGGDR